MTEPTDASAEDAVPPEAARQEAQSRTGGQGATRPEVPSEVPAGEWLVKLSWLGTAAFAVTAVAAAAFPEPLVYVSVPVAIGLFVAGVVAFLWGYVVAIGRSRTDLIGIGGLYFLVGCAPSRVRHQMMWSLALQVAVALVTASARPYTPLAFGILAPTYGLGLAGLWGARYGVFPPRPGFDQASPHAGRVIGDDGAGQGTDHDQRTP